MIDIFHKIAYFRGRIAFSVLAAYSFMIQPAFAQDSGGLSGVVEQLRGQIGSIPNLIVVVAFAVGILLVLTALFHLSKWAKNPNQVEAGPALGKLIVGILMIGLPWLTGTGLDTFGITSAGTTSATGTLQSIK